MCLFHTNKAYITGMVFFLMFPEQFFWQNSIFVTFYSLLSLVKVFTVEANFSNEIAIFYEERNWTNFFIHRNVCPKTLVNFNIVNMKIGQDFLDIQ